MGFSLTARDLPGDPAERQEPLAAQRLAGGSPGTDDSGQVPELGSVVINELLANSAGSRSRLDRAVQYDRSGHRCLGGWYLSDDANDLTRYQIAEGTSIPAGGYLVFSEDQHFANANDPGSREPFGLSKDGETLYLHSGSDGVLTGYSEQENFDASEAGVALGRYLKEHRLATTSWL